MDPAQVVDRTETLKGALGPGVLRWGEPCVAAAAAVLAVVALHCVVVGRLLPALQIAASAVLHMPKMHMKCRFAALCRWSATAGCSTQAGCTWELRDGSRGVVCNVGTTCGSITAVVCLPGCCQRACP